jgi:hypothetical protein
MSNILKDFKSEMPKVHGRTTINHEARMQLMINCSEYVFMDWLHRAFQNKMKEPDVIDCYVKTGFTSDQQQRLMKSLIQKGFLSPTDNDSPTMTQKWNSAFADLDKEFDEFFWVKNFKVCWTGSKPIAKKLYVQLRRNVSREFLMHQRNTYFAYLECEAKLGFARQKMMATVFLGKAERYNEDWESQLQECRKRLNKITEELDKRKDIKPVSKDEVDKLYGKDNK